MKKVIFFILFCLPFFAAAQPKVRIDHSPTLGTSYTLVGKTSPGTVTVLVKIRNLQNAVAPQERRYLSTQTGDIYRFEVTYNLARFLTLSPVDKSKPVVFGSGAYGVYPGCVGSEVDTSFVYRMPCTTTHPVMMRRLSASVEASEARNVSYAFRCKAGDTVYAVRRGLVTRLVRPRERDVDLSTLESTSERTRLTVEHPDGSAVVYSGFAEWAEPLVGEGSEVLPGQPVGIVGGLSPDGEERYRALRLSFYRLVFDDDRATIDRFPASRSVGFEPRFATAEGVLTLPERGEYTALMNDDLLTAEMSKREIRKLKGNKK
ncbi:MAG: M23 family metallopeptidase [Alistipes sp.]|nr:M23 family metallopeptidase [Alistipes senegalensis]MCM1251030.1 M23 family metallopeptidase [Alistipes sp.]